MSKTAGQRIKALRRRSNWTRKQLGERVGVSEPTVRAWEQGLSFPKPENREKLLTVFDTNIDALFPELTVDFLTAVPSKMRAWA